ncbi:hypothetical protein GCM10023168_14170 [Fodinibacter luteus]|uniref:Uncharacterized protein n=1 Tax=Fodinibacter luteus TaxID=552064 RepID=A0ABP8KAL9_9MICO
MDHEIQLLSDGDGLAVIGEPTAVERFLAAEGLPSRDLGLARLSTTLRAGSGAAQVGSQLAANSSRWVQLTPKSAAALKKFEAMKGSSSDVSRAVMMDKGKAKHILEFAKAPGAKALLSNPAVLAGAAGLMAQLAMQQSMDEITDYLATIDKKVDDVLRAQTDAVIADMIAVELLVDEAMTIRERVGRVSEITWSKVQATSMTIARTQAYVLRQLDALSEKVEQQRKVGDMAEASRAAASRVQEWLAVLARCFQLQDAVAVLELDRVLDASPEELDEHRLALRAARQNRLDLITRSTTLMLSRMGAAAGTANDKVLLHPSASGVVVRSSAEVTKSVVDLQVRLGIEGGDGSLEARRWTTAAVEVRDKALRSGADGVGSARHLGDQAFGRAKSAGGRFSAGIADLRDRRRGAKEGSDEGTEQ